MCSQLLTNSTRFLSKYIFISVSESANVFSLENKKDHHCPSLCSLCYLSLGGSLLLGLPVLLEVHTLLLVSLDSRGGSCPDQELSISLCSLPAVECLLL